MNNLLSESEVIMVLRERFPNAVITQQEQSGDIAVSYKGIANAFIAASLVGGEGEYELTHTPDDVCELREELSKNKFHRVEYGYYTPEGEHHNRCPFIDFEDDFRNPLGIEVCETQPDGRIIQYRILGKYEYRMFKDLEGDYGSSSRR